MRRIPAGTRALRGRLRPRTRAKAFRRAITSRTRTRGRSIQGDDHALILESGLFDLEWYNRSTGSRFDRAQAVHHYLETGRAQGFSPHPLFAPAFFAANLPDLDEDEEPLARYIRGRHFRMATHPLFRVRPYLEQHPEALKHRDGPLGHYVEVGASAGARPNEWYDPAPDREPGGLVDWMEARRDEWLGRRADARTAWTRRAPEQYPAPPAPSAASPAPAAPGPAERRSPGDDEPMPGVSVLVAHEGDVDALRLSLVSLREQTRTDWEVVVCCESEAAPAVELLEVVADPRVRVVHQPLPGRVQAWNFALAVARAELVAWLVEGDQWEPARLSSLSAALGESDGIWACDVLQETGEDGRVRYSSRRPTRARLLANAVVDIGVVVADRDETVRAGGFDERLPNAAARDLTLKLSDRSAPVFLPHVGVRRETEPLSRRRAVPAKARPWVDHATMHTWGDVVLNRHLLDWEALRRRRGKKGLTSVLVATYNDWRMTTTCVRAVLRSAQDEGMDVEVVVVDNGCHLLESTVLQSLPLRFGRVKVVPSPVNRGFGLGNNLALSKARGDVVVFLNNDTEVRPGWLAPLREALEDPEVLGAQSLLVYPDGTIQSAGVAFPHGGGIPHALLQGFPVEDADGVGALRFHALTAASMAVRRADLVALRGFDPVFRNGMEDIDLGLRLRGRRSGHFVVRPDSVVLHHESKSEGRFKRFGVNRKVYLERWQAEAPQDDSVLWEACGYELVGREVRNPPADDRRLGVQLPVLTRRPLTSVREGAPRLRWAIKNPAPAGPAGEVWGDTHFARHLASALRELGQQVVIDHRDAFERRSGRFDDVVLVLRGLTPYRPAFGQVNLLWLISHPDMFARWEAEAYDTVFAASTSWADATSRAWGAQVKPLLQATDPAVFHPDVALPDTGHPVLFVGSSRKQLRPIVKQAVDAGLPLSVYGGTWKGLIPPRFVKGEYLPNQEVGAAYRSAGVVLNDHWEDMRVEGFISNRLFDAAAAGARVITDDVVGLPDVFARSVQVARTQDDLARLASAQDLDAVFGDDAERREVAARIHREHSFLARARTLLEEALEQRSRRGLG